MSMTSFPNCILEGVVVFSLECMTLNNCRNVGLKPRVLIGGQLRTLMAMLSVATAPVRWCGWASIFVA